MQKLAIASIIYIPSPIFCNGTPSPYVLIPFCCSGYDKPVTHKETIIKDAEKKEKKRRKDAEVFF